LKPHILTVISLPLTVPDVTDVSFAATRCQLMHIAGVTIFITITWEF